jgi:hypothetical protein
LLLAGNIEGREPDEEKITNMILSIIAQSDDGNNQTIFYVDES